MCAAWREAGNAAAGRAFVQPEQVAGVEERRTHDAEEEVGGADDAAAVVAKVQMKVAVAYGGVGVGGKVGVAFAAVVGVGDVDGAAHTADAAVLVGACQRRAVKVAVGNAVGAVFLREGL